MRVLVTGAGGMLGQDMVSAAAAARHDVTAATHSELDITDAAAVERAFAEAEPEVLVNCAAWTDVDGAEDNEADATALNGEAARILAAAAAAADAAVVYPSTDYVFDGTAAEPYTVAAQTGPISAYGRSKLAGEQATMAANPRHFIVRTSWVFGPYGRNFVETMLGLGRERGEVNVVNDQIGCPTYTGHLASGLTALIDSSFYGIHHMAGAGACSWYDFAVEIFKQAGVECQVLSMTSDMLDRPAPRPAFSVLESEREHPVLLPGWHDGLADYLAERAQTGARA